MGYFIEVERGVKLFVEDIGVGVPVLLLHGWPLNHRMFEYQVSQLPRYSFRCILPDLRGYGQSDKPWQGYDYDRMSDDIRALIDTLGLDRVKLVGFSMGGAIAIRYMCRHFGHRVGQLVLLSAAAPKFTRAPDYPYGMAKEQVDSLLMDIHRDRPKTIAQFGESFFASKISPEFRGWFNDMTLAAGGHSTSASALSLRDEDLRDDLENVFAPTTIFHGKQDLICPFEFALLMHQGITGSTLIPFEHSGHGIFYDELELFNFNFIHTLSRFR
jgi:non-heme chloroperoxidase